MSRAAAIPGREATGNRYALYGARSAKRERSDRPRNVPMSKRGERPFFAHSYPTAAPLKRDVAHIIFDATFTCDRTVTLRYPRFTRVKRTLKALVRTSKVFEHLYARRWGVPVRKVVVCRMDERAEINVTADLWVEVSDDGTTWRRSKFAPTAREVARNCRELRAIIATYVTVVEAAGSRMSRVQPWFRIVAQGTETGTVLGVVPRRWNPDAGRYETTGGEWMITDDSTAYQAWCLNLAGVRLTSAA